MAVEIALALWREFGYDISDDAILQGLTDARMPARIEVLRRHPLLLLDGCHNPDGAKMLAATLTRADFEENLVGVLGVLADKDYKDMLSDLAPCFAKIYTVTPNCPRALSAEELQKEHASTPTPRPPDSVARCHPQGRGLRGREQPRGRCCLRFALPCRRGPPAASQRSRKITGHRISTKYAPVSLYHNDTGFLFCLNTPCRKLPVDF